MEQNKQYLEKERELRTLLGFTPPRDGLLFLVTGKLSLDVLVLDKKLGTPDGTSTVDFLKQHFGARALQLVNEML